MSLTAHLLWQRETNLPKGKIYTHNADTRRHPLTQGEIEAAARNQATKTANIERVYNAIAAAKAPISMAGIETITNISRVTILRACEELENWPGGPRIVRHKGKRHTFEVANAKVSGAGTASAGLPGWQANGETE